MPQTLHLSVLSVDVMFGEKEVVASDDHEQMPRVLSVGHPRVSVLRYPCFLVACHTSYYAHQRETCRAASLSL